MTGMMVMTMMTTMKMKITVVTMMMVMTIPTTATQIHPLYVTICDHGKTKFRHHLWQFVIRQRTLTQQKLESPI